MKITRQCCHQALFMIILFLLTSFPSSSWMKKTPSARAQSLYSLAKGLEAKRRDLAASISVQTGLSVDEADKEVELSIARLSDWAAHCDKVQGGTLVRLFFILCKVYEKLLQ